MSVVYGKRSLSDMEFWKQMIKLEREVRNSLLHDFGIKNRKELRNAMEHGVGRCEDLETITTG